MREGGVEVLDYQLQFSFYRNLIKAEELSRFPFNLYDLESSSPICYVVTFFFHGTRDLLSTSNCEDVKKKWALFALKNIGWYGSALGFCITQILRTGIPAFVSIKSGRLLISSGNFVKSRLCQSS